MEISSENVSDVRKTFEVTLRRIFEKYLSPSESTLPRRKYIYLKKSNKICKISVDEITHVEVDGRYSYLFRNKEKYILSKSLKSMLLYLEKSSFVQSHRNTIVNKNRIVEIFPNENLIVFDNGSHTTMSGRFKNSLLKELDIIQ